MIAYAAIAGPARVRLFGFIGMAIGLLAAPTVGATLLLAMALLHLTPFAPAWLKWAPVLEIAGAVVGWQIGADVASRRHLARFQRGLTTLGAPDAADVRYSIEPEGLGVTSERISHFIRWPALVQVIPSPALWLLQADEVTIVLPRRAFATPDEERAFMDQLLAAMSPEARDRSRAAVGSLISSR